MSALPPGPRAPVAWQTAQWVLRPVELLERCAQRFGDPFTLRTAWTAGAPLVLTSNPDAIAAIFRDAEGSLSSGSTAPLLEPFAGPTSIMVLDGPEHLRRRRLLLPPFHGERVRSLRGEVARLAADEVARWQPGSPLRAHERMRALTLEIIVRVVFGARQDRHVAALRDAVGRALGITHSAPRLLAMALLRRDLGRFSPYGAFARAVERVDEMLWPLIRDPEPPAGSILAMLREARHEDGSPQSDRELRDQLVTLLAAGHETTATSLAWAIELLARRPDVAEWVRAGGEAELDALVREVLRLRPVLSIAARRVTRPYELGGHVLAPGTHLAPCILLAQRRRDLWGDDAARFRPARWLEPGTPPHAQAFIPFGGGVRRCAGAPFATMEMAEVLRVVVGQVALTPVSPRSERAVRRSVTLAPARGGAVTVTGRV